MFDKLDERSGGTIADGWLVGIHLDDCVVDAHAGEGGENVLYCVNFYGAFGEGGRALDGLDLIDIGMDERLVREIDTAEFEAVVLGSGLERKRDFFPSMQGSAF